MVRTHRSPLVRFASLVAASALGVVGSACIIVIPGPPPPTEDQDGDGYTWAIDCDDWDPSVHDECFLDGEDQDSDEDGVSDEDEASRGTDPFLPDSDGDGQGDGEEIACGSSPIDPFLLCDPVQEPPVDEPAQEEPADADADGRTDEEEQARGTDPTSADTDGDGVDDGAEHACGSSPLDPYLVCPAPPAEQPAQEEPAQEEPAQEEPAGDEPADGHDHAQCDEEHAADGA